MNKLLLEIGTEEIPASYIPVAEKKLREIAVKKFETSLLPHGRIHTFGTPRRIVLIADGIPDEQKREKRKVTGPPAKVGIDKDGKPTKAGQKFAEKFGKNFGEVQIESTPKGDYLYLVIEKGGMKSASLLEQILPLIISEIPFPKAMRWGVGSVKFARPIRSILALLGEEKLLFSIDDLSSGDKTFGHRFLSDGPVIVSDPDSYEETLSSLSVFVSSEKRRGIILNEIQKIEKDHGVRVIQDEELLQTVCYLTEFPVAVLGRFNEDYLNLPRELLITVLKHHQKYFGVEDKNGKITNCFVAISNIACDEMSEILKGFERVLVARLDDARFFFNEDRKHRLAEFEKKLAGVTYQKGLGTIAEKTERVRKIASQISEKICPDKKEVVEIAAKLSKADLTTLMVYEFPELQGVMGREYARAEGLGETVAYAIDEHYRPRFAGDDLPSSDTASCVAIADKIETICGFFALGKVPTGSEDPFSLRRHAQGIIRILLSGCEGLSLFQLINWSIASLPDNLKKPETFQQEIHNFFSGRIKNNFMDRGIPYDVIDAVLNVSPPNYDMLPDTLKRCEALAEMKKEDYSENLAITFKRAANIVIKHHLFNVDENLLSEEVETALYQSLKLREKNVAKLFKEKNFSGILKEVAQMRSEVDNFFDGVLVMTDDEKIRNNRLSLLRQVVRLFDGFADFSKLVFS